MQSSPARIAVLPLDQNNALDQLRRRFIYGLTLTAMLSSMGGLLSFFITGQSEPTPFISVFFVIGLSVVVFNFIRAGQFERGANVLIGGLLLTYLALDYLPVIYLVGTLTLISGALLSRQRLFLGMNLLVFGKLIYLIVLEAVDNGLTPTPDGELLVISACTLLIISITTRFFISAAEESAVRNRRSAELFRASIEIGQTMAGVLDERALLNQTVDLVRDRFGFYHVQVFRIDDERDYAVLVASTGEAGRRLLQRGHRLRVGSQSVIGRVTQIGELIITRDTEGDQVHAKNELLAATRSELALPLVEGDQIIGALDVQSVERDAFDEVDIQALQIVANQLAASIRVGRLFTAQEQSLKDNKRLFIESEASMREIQRLNRQLTRTAWEDYLEAPTSPTGTLLLADGNLRQEADWTPAMVEAASRGRPHRDLGQQQTIAVPIVLRGEVLGAIEVVTTPETRGEDTIQLMQAIAQRLAISLDNARLFEEAQTAAQQEQRINEIVGRYQSASTIDDLLQITLAELTEILGAHSGSIRLSALGVDQQRLNGAGDDEDGYPMNGHRQNGGSSS